MGRDASLPGRRSACPLELSHLKVFCADANHLLAMKCLATRIGEEFQDLDDIRYLLRHLGLRKYEDALEAIKKYYPLEKRFPPRALYALEGLLQDGDPNRPQ